MTDNPPPPDQSAQPASPERDVATDIARADTALGVSSFATVGTIVAGVIGLAFDGGAALAIAPVVGAAVGALAGALVGKKAWERLLDQN